MGYTHYWYRPPTLEAERFAAFARDVQALLDALPDHTGLLWPSANRTVVICGGDGTGEPVITDARVILNGCDEFALDEAHEGFCVEREFDPEGWTCWDEHGRAIEFCKTARKPYDLLVTAALIALKARFPEVEVRSDGDVQDWAAGRTLYERVIGPAPRQKPWDLSQARTGLSRSHQTGVKR